jgi:hypothetical protein
MRVPGSAEARPRVGMRALLLALSFAEGAAVMAAELCGA